MENQNKTNMDLPFSDETSAKGGSQKAVPSLNAIMEASLTLLKTQNFERLSPENLAQALAVNKAAKIIFLKRFPDETAILKGILHQTLQNFKQVHKPQKLPLKELMFDGCMDYLDQLSHQKQAYSKIFSLDLFNPKHALLISGHFHALVQHILDKEENSWQKSIILSSFPILFHWILETWKSDDTLDQSKTMSTLDQGIAKVISMFRAMGFSD